MYLRTKVKRKFLLIFYIKPYFIFQIQNTLVHLILCFKNLYKWNAEIYYLRKIMEILYIYICRSLNFLGLQSRFIKEQFTCIEIKNF